MIDPEALEKLSGIVADKVFRAAAASGAIEIADRTHTEILNDLIELVENTPADSLFWQITLVHTDSLVSEARRYRDKGEPLFASLMYATWIEHWVNGVITDLASRNGMSDSIRTSIIRESSIRAKLGWLPRVLGAPEFNEAHRKDALKIIEHRNSFVHYKYKRHDRNAEAELKELIKRFDGSVEYFEQYYLTNFLSGFGKIDDLKR